MIKKQFFFALFALFFFKPIDAETKKRRRVFSRKWSLSVVNAYSLYNLPKNFSGKSNSRWEDIDGPMHPFFSALEISRNFGYYEIGAKIQNLGPVFVSPFFKWNTNKNNSKAKSIFSLTLGVSPANIFGVWLRLSLGLSLNPFISVSPFIGAAGYYEIKDLSKYIAGKSLHFNTGLRISLYR